jgi:hypothetical protein
MAVVISEKICRFVSACAPPVTRRNGDVTQIKPTNVSCRGAPARAAKGPYSCSSSSQKDRGPHIIARHQLSHLSVWVAVDRLNKRGSSGNAKSVNCVITFTGPKSITPREATLA